MSSQLSNAPSRAKQLLFAFGIYRIILATSLLVLAFVPDAAIGLLPSVTVTSFQLATFAYLVLAILGILPTTNEQISQKTVTVLLITDILLLTLILRYSGGVDTGFGSLILITVGVGGLLLPFQQSLLIAATATSGIVYTELLPFAGEGNKDLLRAALLGVGYFSETLFLQYVGQRVKTTEQLARAQADTITDLRQLNELIVQRMRTGIIVTTSTGRIRLLNDSARDYLNITEKRPQSLVEPIMQRLLQWEKEPRYVAPTYQVDENHSEFSINFARLQSSETSDIIIFMEDTGKMTQQAQQLKLASLGRLTASIAHEIRNPLGAIGHAAQLLEEATHLDDADKRLLTIIINHTQRVNTIIETILELSRRRPAHVSAIWLSELINQCITEREMHTDRHQDKITVVAQVDGEIEIDHSQIKQVMHNLIDNGLRYSEKQTGNRTVVVTTGKLSDTKQLYIDISDQGAGVKEDQIEHLFEPFYTTENTGTGLGLYIAKQLCEANRLQLTYIQNKTGACFRLLFAHSISLVASNAP